MMFLTKLFKLFEKKLGQKGFKGAKPPWKKA